jgi:uncharacterized membrane protein
MLSAAWACLLVRYATGSAKWDTWSRLFEVIGVAALPVTIIAAFIDTRGFDFLIHPRTDAPLIWHMTAGLTATAAFAAHYLWRRRRSTSELTARQALGDVGLATFGMVALVATGLIAGQMVFGT